MGRCHSVNGTGLHQAIDSIHSDDTGFGSPARYG